MTKQAHNKYWTKDLVLAEARKHDSQSSWRKHGKGSMAAARANGWMALATAHMSSLQKPKGYWTKQRVMQEAEKYSYLTEWINSEQSSYSTAKRNGWLKEACAHMVSPKKAMGFWTRENLIDDAKKYLTKSQWKKNNASAYATAVSKGLLDVCSAHMTSVRKPDGYWNKQNCHQSSKKYMTIADWSKSEGGAYYAAKKNGWINDVTSHMHKVFSHGEYTIYKYLLEHDISFECQKRFKDLKDKRQLPYDFYLRDFDLVIEYQGRQHFGTSASSRFRKDAVSQPRRDAMKKGYAEKNGLFYLDVSVENTEKIESIVYQKICRISEVKKLKVEFVRRNLTKKEIGILANLGAWTKESVIEDAKKYTKTVDWNNCGNAASQVARRKGWYVEATQHMTQSQKPKGYWTKERVLEDALKYKSKKEWFIKSQSGYATAQAKGWLKEATEHMIKAQA
jgi:hypothetical protein